MKSQHQINMDVVLDVDQKTLLITQEINYHNTSNDTLSQLLFHDWANSFSSKTTALGKRFSEDYLRRFYYAKDEERGSTTIKSVLNSKNESLNWERYQESADILSVTPSSPIVPGAAYSITFTYTIKIPSDKFTRFGYHDNGNFSLRYWHIVPAMYTSGWQVYNNKDLDDLYTPLLDYSIDFTLPQTYNLTTSLNEITSVLTKNALQKTVRLTGENRNKVHLFIETKNSFYSFTTDNIEFISNIEDNDLMPEMKSVAIHKIFSFLNNKLGTYPFEKVVVSESDYKSNPVYGLNQLPDILRPFPDGFQYEIKQLKTITEDYLERTLIIDPRHDAWIKDALHIYLMMEYTEQYYPEMKLIGNLSKVIGLRWFHAADLDFNDQYFMGYKNMTRLFLDQSLTTPQDSLIKFNKNIANAYKAGVGLKYLEDYLEDDNIIANSIREFYTENKLQPTTPLAFKEILKRNSKKDVDWFFDNYIATNTKLDFKIKSVRKKEDSLIVTIADKTNSGMPVSLVALRGKDFVSKTWVGNIKGKKKVTISNEKISKLVLDYDQNIPENNRRNNYKNLKWILNKPIQFRLLQDFEDPKYNQLFFMPEFDFNVYDGLTFGSKFYNKTFIRKPFNYKITPTFGTESKTLLGSAGFSYSNNVADDGLYLIRYGLSGNVFSYAQDLLYYRISPSMSFYYRTKNRRSNEIQRLTFRSVNVYRELDEENPVVTPNYSVFNARYTFSNPNLLHLTNYSVDYQLSKNFSKISGTFNYRKMFLNNRQINFRLFAGIFLFNETKKDGNFFSFALDRPTDYLFDYSYLGRSEETGLVSQQIILAEGGFKSKLEYQFANQWMTTLNADTNVWNWIFVYGDLGFVKSKLNSSQFVYDAGIRLSLVADYFELFFPVVSNNGWEISQPNYGEKIRFIVTLSPQTLIKLFTREWY
ncbi:metalloprotease [Aquimarina sp. W85]|uniref:metalloprotease n=1 Tax=Aquimarina rhodophyticola TaxID=3342246 RepID=UPI00366FF2A6